MSGRALVLALLVGLIPAGAEAQELTFVRTWGSVGCGGGEMRKPNDVATTSAGEVFVADTGCYRVQVFTTEGVLLREITAPDFMGPHKIALDEARGRLYVYDWEHDAVLRFGFDGTYQLTWPDDGAWLAVLDDLSVDSAGRVYAVDYLVNRVLVFSPEGALVDSSDVTIQHARSVVCQPDGGAWVYERGVIESFDAEWNLLASWSPGGGFLSSMDVGPDGRVYVTETLPSRLTAFEPDGQLVGSVTQQGPLPGMLQTPTGVAVSDSGEIFVADRDNDRVQVFLVPNTPVLPVRWGTIKAMPWRRR
jgi:DNA-binding beta-propeller fold protein YncE